MWTGPRCARFSTIVFAVHLRQHPVDDRDVEPLADRHDQPVPAVAGNIYGMARFLQALGDIVGGFAIVFDNQDFSWRRLYRAAPAR